MPLSKDPGGSGTECDGRKSETYCSLCYRDGEFIGKDCTVAQMQDVDRQERARLQLVKPALTERGARQVRQG